MFLTKLKTTLLYKNLLNNYHFIVIGIVNISLIYYFSNIIFIVIFIGYIIYIFLKNSKMAIFASFIFLIFFLGFVISGLNYKNRILGEKSASMVVIERDKTDNGYKLTLKGKIGASYLNTRDFYDIGDILYIKGTFIDIDSNHIPLLFDYQKYCKYQGIYTQIIDPIISKQGNKFVISKIQYTFFNYYENNFSPISASYLKALVLGDKSTLDEETLNNINSLGISHLFVVSGLHVSLLIGIITKIISKVFKNNLVVNSITTVVLIIYAFMTNLMVSVLRVVIAYIIKNINSKYQLKLTTLDILSVVTIILLLFNPYYIYTSSFILSFGLTYSLLIGSKLLEEKKFLKSLLKMSIYCQIVSIPLSYNFNNKLNLLSLIFNLIFVPFVSYIFLPISLIVSFFPFLNGFYEWIIKVFESVLTLSSNISIYVNLPYINVIYIMVLIVIIYLFFKMIETRQIKRIIFLILIIYLFLWINTASLDIYDQIIFFDLPNGEATLIHGAFNKYNILVDTGDIPKSDNPITSYLRKRGIRKLDFVIITHSDSDHIGGLETIMKEIRVKNIITNYYEKRSLFNEYKKINSKVNIYYLKKGNDFSFKKVNFKIISPYYNIGDINNNSLVFLLTVDNMKILFTGDIEEKGEKQIDEYIECDILKIAHHGSKTSTTKEFLEKIKYDTAIIMNGYQNIFNFPTDTVIKRIKNKKYYVTGWQKTIIYQKLFFKDKFNVMICFPKP